MGREIFQQVRWITLDQDGSSRIKVDVERWEIMKGKRK